jgi:phenylacetate-coenzyme A ligase PaaK-like adenylate-forming protein
MDALLNNRYKVFKTSGSSGKAAILVYDVKEPWKSTAYEIVRGMGCNTFLDLPNVFFRALWRKPLGIAVIAVIGAHHGTASGMFSLIPSFFMPSKGFSVNLSDEAIVEELNRFNPFTVVAYPTKLEMLAHAQLKGKLKIRPKYIKTISEVLTPSAKALIEKAFGVKARDTYAASEAAIIAGDCRQSMGLHIHEDVCLVEPVDKDGNPIKEGNLSHKVYVTNLLKYTQPLIRYELEDVISVTHKPCLCGMPTPRIEAVYGRNFDMLWVKMADGSFRHLHPQGVDAHITLVKGVKNYQVIQEDFSRLKVYILLEPEANEEKTLGEVKKSLLHTFKETGVESAVTLDIMSVSDILRDPVSQKIRRIISKVQPMA